MSKLLNTCLNLQRRRIVSWWGGSHAGWSAEAEARTAAPTSSRPCCPPGSCRDWSPPAPGTQSPSPCSSWCTGSSEKYLHWLKIFVVKIFALCNLQLRWVVSRPISNVIDGQLAPLQLSFSNSNKKPISSLMFLCLLSASPKGGNMEALNYANYSCSNISPLSY